MSTVIYTDEYPRTHGSGQLWRLVRTSRSRSDGTATIPALQVEFRVGQDAMGVDRWEEPTAINPALLMQYVLHLREPEFCNCADHERDRIFPRNNASA